MKRLSALLLAAALFGAIGFAKQAAAQLPGNNSHIEVSFVMVLAKNAKGEVETRPITSVYTVRLAEDVQRFCQRAPKIREILLAYLTKYPPEIGHNNRLKLEGLGQKVVPYVNRMFGVVVVTDAVLLEGGRKLTKGTATGLPFAQIQGCGRVQEEYEQRMNQLLKKREAEDAQ